MDLRRTPLLPLDALLAVVREFFLESVSRSGLDRCLRRHGVGNLNVLKPAAPKEPYKRSKGYEPGYLHIDVKYRPRMADEASRRYLFVATNRAMRWVFVAVKANETAASARGCLKALHRAWPLRIIWLLTNGREFTHRLFASRERQRSSNHEFDQLCQALIIKLTQPKTPRIKGTEGRFNGRIADVLRTYRFHSGEYLKQTLRYVALYNHQLPQSALKSQMPIWAMKDWHASHPHLFMKLPYDRPACDVFLSAGGIVGCARKPLADRHKIVRKSLTVMETTP